MQEVETLFHEAGHCLQHMLTGEHTYSSHCMLRSSTALFDAHAAAALHSAGGKQGLHGLALYLQSALLPV